MPTTNLVLPFSDYKSPISNDRKFRLIRKWKATDPAARSGARLRKGPVRSNQHCLTGLD